MPAQKTKCPKCKSPNPRPIVYGYPTPEAEKRAESGEFALGGCVVHDEYPKWRCPRCGHQWGKTLR